MLLIGQQLCDAKLGEGWGWEPMVGLCTHVYGSKLIKLSFPGDKRVLDGDQGILMVR